MPPRALLRRYVRTALWLATAALLLARAPRLLAAAANNLAARALRAEWAPLSEEMGLPRCTPRLPASAAAPLLDLAARLDPASPRVALNRGRVAWLEGDCAAARAAWEQAVARAPHDEVAAFWRFWAADADPALLSPAQAARVAQYARLAGARAERAGDTAAAGDWYESAMALDPGRASAEALAKFYRGQKQPEQALAAWQRAAAALPDDDAEHWWAQAQAAALAGDAEGAARAYEQGAALAADAYDFWMAQAKVLHALDRPREEEHAYQAAITAHPDALAPYLELGHLWLSQGQWAGALQWYQAAHEVAPRDVRPLYYAGLACAQAGQEEQAAAWFERALRLDPNHRDSHYQLAQALYRSGEVERAAQELAAAIELHRGQPWQWALQLGDWRLERGDREGALAAYTRALEWKPGEAAIVERIERAGGQEEGR